MEERVVSWPWTAGLVVLLASGCGPINSKSPAPDVAGNWAMTYDDMIGVELTVGGTVYSQTLGAAGGTVTIDHMGQPFSFDLDCALPQVVCPSEAWPATVSAVQRNAIFPHRMFVNLPEQYCAVAEVAADPAECGAGTQNPDCVTVCPEGQVMTRNRERFGVIAEDGLSFDLLLGAGLATNGLNCALLGVSAAHASLRSTGSADTMDWTAVAMEAGTVTVAFAGGCLWIAPGTPTMEARGLAIGASLKFTTGFTGARVP